MTDCNHPIAPPSELLLEWINKHYGCKVDREIGGVERAIATQASRWGADQELEECDKALRKIWQMDHVSTVDDFLRELRAARRPKPPSLKDQALETLHSMRIAPVVINGINVNADVMNKYEIIRRALESLPS